jgi:tripartite ATP-independent transporter DctP family solute receptor
VRRKCRKGRGDQGRDSDLLGEDEKRVEGILIMRINKKAASYMIIVVFIMSMFLVAGCGAKKDASAVGGDKKPITLRLGHGVPVEYSWHRAAVFFADKVKEKTNGRVEVKVFPGGQLGGEKAQIEGLMAGTHDFTLSTQAPLSNWLPQFMALDMPYLISTEAQADKILSGEVGKYLADLLPSKGLYHLGWGENGFRCFTNNVRPLRKPEDLKGLKIRVMENRLMIDTFKMWGADPTPIPFPELYTALQQGTVDGQENPVSIIDNSRFPEVQKFLTISNHFYSPMIFFGSKITMDKLPADLQKIIREAALEACIYEKKIVREDNANAVAKMEKAGIKVNRLTDAEIKVWAQTSRPIYDMYKDKMGAEIFGKVMNALK